MLSASLVALMTLAACVAGFVDAIAGGGGLIVLPCLLLAGLPPHYALSANKFSATLGTSIALRTFASQGLVLWRVALLGVPFSLLGAFVGSILTLYIPAEQLSAILVLLLPVALAITLMPKPLRKEPSSTPVRPWKVALVCLLIGLYDGFFGPGTGSFLILAFHAFLAIDFLHASATAKVLNLASNLASTLTFIVSGTMLWFLAVPMALGSITGNILGSRFAIRKGSEGVRRVLAFSLILLTATMLYKYFVPQLIRLCTS